MNSSDFCHEILDCPGLYVDAFRGRFLRQTQDPNAAFILTHYHGDHYQSLPRKGKYQGPALIHCTPVTADLLIQVHEVPSAFVVEHEYGQTFQYCMKGKGQQRAQITFYDANHCPGACIVLIQLPNGITHLHTGDMRYHDRFKSYPLLREAVANQQLDLVYLDTTYSHPKHDFVPQEDAIEAIASQTEELLSGDSSTLVLLSCYSIGKEKVLWEAATRTNQMVCVNERKFRMLECIKGHKSQVSSQIIHRCTQDPSESDIHVIPMGLAGTTWPYFRPNFLKCADYVEKLEKDYDKVVAFLPTGWANASKWNKEHSVSQKEVNLSNGKTLQVEVRLVSYSEHSAFSELISFVQYLRPRKVVPTVFSDEADCRKIEDRFRNLLDTTRAKKVFFRSMEQQQPIINNKHAAKEQKTDATTETPVSLETERTLLDMQVKEAGVGHKSKDPLVVEDVDSGSDIEIVGVKPTSLTASTPTQKPNMEKLDTLVAMGFEIDKARKCLERWKGNLDSAIEVLLSNGHDTSDVQNLETPKEPPLLSKRRIESRSPQLLSELLSSPRKKQKSSPSSLITRFFSKKTP